MKNALKLIPPAVAALAALALGGCTAGSKPARPAAPPPAADAPRLAQLRAELEKVLAARGLRLDAEGRAVSRATGKAVSAVPLREYVTPSRTDDAVSGNANLYWLHAFRGDYDSNGEVNISDLTAVGQHFGKNNFSPDWATAAHVADGDGNGEINIADVTPIGMNFSAVTGGYAIEAREAAGEWRDYGFMDFESGFPTNNTLEYGYYAYGGIIEAEYRVRPVGRSRDFDWTVYNLTDSAEAETRSALGLVDGRPMVAYLSSTQSMATYLGFAVATQERPLSPGDWYIEHALLDDMPLDLCPNPVSIQGRPALSYTRGDPGGASESLYFNIRSSGAGEPATWSQHLITGPAPGSFRTVTVVREGRPAVFYNGNGLAMFQAATALPTSTADWSGINCDPAFNDFRLPVVAASGPWVFACGAAVTPSDYLLYSHSTNPALSGPADFSEYLLLPWASITDPSALCLIAGIPCIVTSDMAASALRFIQAGTRDADSAGNWFMHSIITSPAGDDHWFPTMALIEGRPAVVAGYGAKQLHWTGGQWPDSDGDWRHQSLDPALAQQFVQIASAGGLPILSYTQVDGSGAPELMIAVAQEQGASL